MGLDFLKLLVHGGRNMNTILEINNDAINTVADVVISMYEATSKTGELCVTQINNPGYVEFVGFLRCEMDMEAFDRDFNSLGTSIMEMVNDIEPRVYAFEETLEEMIGGFKNNYFKSFAEARVYRIAKLREVGAPDAVIDFEIKAFTYYYILNSYCNTL